MDPEQEQMIAEWKAKTDAMEATLRQRVKPKNFIELTKIPKKTDARALTSMIVTASKMIPKSVEICYRSKDDHELEPIGVIEFKSASDAFVAADRIRNSLYGNRWSVWLTEEPEYKNPDDNTANKLSSHF